MLIDNCLLLITYCSLLTAHCSLLTAHYLLPVAYHSLITAHCLLPIAYCLLPIAHYSLLISYFLLLLLIFHCSLPTNHFSYQIPMIPIFIISLYSNDIDKISVTKHSAVFLQRQMYPMALCICSRQSSPNSPARTALILCIPSLFSVKSKFSISFAIDCYSCINDSICLY
ncbi:hypothetical protein DW690_20975 [Dorea longicatena]|nr:hypothetical protein DW690_20975 [Dorea longicatena]